MLKTGETDQENIARLKPRSKADFKMIRLNMVGYYLFFKEIQISKMKH